MNKFVLLVEFQVKPESLDHFNRIIEVNARASVANESGCRQFDVCTESSRPHVVYLYEVYDDRSSFDVHLASTHFKSFAQATLAMIQQRVIATWKRVAP